MGEEYSIKFQIFHITPGLVNLHEMNLYIYLHVLHRCSHRRPTSPDQLLSVDS